MEEETPPQPLQVRAKCSHIRWREQGQGQGQGQEGQEMLLRSWMRWQWQWGCSHIGGPSSDTPAADYCTVVSP